MMRRFAWLTLLIFIILFLFWNIFAADRHIVEIEAETARPMLVRDTLSGFFGQVNAVDLPCVFLKGADELPDGLEWTPAATSTDAVPWEIGQERSCVNPLDTASTESVLSLEFDIRSIPEEARITDVALLLTTVGYYTNTEDPVKLKINDHMDYRPSVTGPLRNFCDAYNLDIYIFGLVCPGNTYDSGIPVPEDTMLHSIRLGDTAVADLQEQLDDGWFAVGVVADLLPAGLFDSFDTTIIYIDAPAGKHKLRVEYDLPCSVHVRTSFPGGYIYFNHTTHTSPFDTAVYAWDPCTLSTDSIQSVGDDTTRYLFTGWSDGGALTHIVEPETDTTFIANFVLQHYLTLNNGGYGTVDGEGWYDEGDTAYFSVSPDTIEAGDTRIVFDGWTGAGPDSYTGGANPAWVVMNHPNTETANWKRMFYIRTSFTGCGTGTPAQSGEGWYDEGSSAPITTSDTVITGSGMYLFSMWTGGTFDDGFSSSTEILVDTARTAVAHYVPDIELSPPDTTTGANLDTLLVPVLFQGSVSYLLAHIGFDLHFDTNYLQYLELLPHPDFSWDNLTGTDISTGDSGRVSIEADDGDGFLAEEGDTLLFIAFQVAYDALGESYITFSDFRFDVEGATTTPGIFIVESVPAVVEFHTSYGFGPLVIDGDTVMSPFIVEWLTATPYTIEAPELAYWGSIRYVFSHWSDGGEREHTVYVFGDTAFTAFYSVQYYLELVSDYGTTDGEGWYDEGAPATFSVSPETVTVGDIRRIFVQWVGVGDGSYTGGDNPASCTMNAPITETAEWRTQYYLHLAYTGCGTAEPEQTGEGWYDAGDWADITTEEAVSGYYFNWWIDGTFVDPTQAATQVLVDTTVTATAVYADEPPFIELSPPETTLALIGLPVGVPALFFASSEYPVDSFAFTVRFDNITVRFDSVANGSIEWDELISYDLSSGSAGRVLIAGGSIPPETVPPACSLLVIWFTVRYTADDSSIIHFSDFSYDLAAATTEDGMVLVRRWQNVRIQNSFGGGVVYLDTVMHSSPFDTTLLLFSSHRIGTDSIQTLLPGVRYLFTGWSDGGEISHTVEIASDTVFTAAFDTTYRLVVRSPFGTTEGSGWYSPGEEIEFSVSPDTIETSDTRHYFTGWLGEGDGSFTGYENPANCTMNSPILEDAEWQTYYYLTLTYSGCGGAVPTQTGEGWYASGVRANITTDDIVMDGDSTYYFNCWMGGEFTDPYSNETDVLMSSPVVAEAVYSTSPELFLVIPEDTSFATRGEPVAIPVMLTTDEPREIDSLFLVACFNNIMFDYLSLLPYLPWDTLAGVDISSSDTGRVAVFARSDTGFTLTGTDTLFYLILYTDDMATGLSPIALRGFRFDIASARTRDGVIVVSTSTVHVTIRTSFPGGKVKVDGVEHDSPYNDTWIVRSVHTIGVDSVQATGASIRHIFINWNDGGAITHRVSTTVPTAYVAYFSTQFYLTVEAGGHGMAEGEGWYDVGDIATFSVLPETVAVDGVRYIFVRWEGFGTGSYAGEDNPANCVMYSPILETAVWKSQYYLTLDYTGCEAEPAQSGEGWYDAGAWAGIYTEPLVESDSERSVFAFWTGGIFEDTSANATRLLVDTVRTATAHYSHIEVSPPAEMFAEYGEIVSVPVVLRTSDSVRVDSTGLVFNFDADIMNYLSISDCAGIGWSFLFAYDLSSGSYGRVAVAAGSASGGLWLGAVDTLFCLNFEITASSGFSPMHISNISGDLEGAGTRDGILHVSYPVDVSVISSAGDSIYFDGSTRRSPFDTTVLAGETHTIGADSIVSTGTPGERYLFSGWSDGGEMIHSVRIASDTVFRAEYDLQYYLTVVSDYGTTDGEGWYNDGETPTFSVLPDTLVFSDTMRVIFSDWTGEGDGSYTGSDNPANCVMNSPIVETANWTVQYYLAVLSDYGTTEGSGWYDVGATPTFSVSPETLTFSDTMRVIFSGWTGEGSRSYTGSDNPASCVMNSPIVETANWTRQYYLTVSNGGRGTVRGEGWYDEATWAHFDISPEIIDSTRNIRYQFTGWLGDGDSSFTGYANPCSVRVFSPITETAVWQLQFYLIVSSSYGTTDGEGYHPAGSVVMFSVSPDTIEDLGNKRHIFSGWAGDGDGSYTGGDNPGYCIMNEPLSEIASWDTQFYITLDYDSTGLAVPEQEGEGWVNRDSWTPIYTEPIVYDGELRYRFLHWVGGDFEDEHSYSTTALVDTSRTFTAVYTGYEVSPPETSWVLPGDTVLVPAMFYNTSAALLTSVGLDCFYPSDMFTFLDLVRSDTLDWGTLNHLDIEPGHIRVFASNYPPLYVIPPVPLFYFKFAVSTDATGRDTIHFESLTFDISSAATFPGLVGVLEAKHITITTSDELGQVQVDGVWYGVPATFVWETGSYHNIGTQDFHPVSEGVVDFFTDWSDGGEQYHTIVVSDNDTLTANYESRYLLSVETAYGTASGGGYYPEGTDVLFSVSPDTVCEEGVRHIFLSWTGTGDGSYTGTNNPAIAVMYSPITETANWRTDYYLTVVSDYGATEGAGWYEQGSSVEFSVLPDVVDSTEVIRHIFTGWTGTGYGSYTGGANPAVATMNSPIIETANWTRQYYLDIVTGYSSSDDEGWYDAGDTVEFAIDGTSVPISDGVRAVFVSWTGEGIGSYTGDGNPATCVMLSPVVETAAWTVRYRVDIISDYGTPTGAGWYAEGDDVVFSVSPDTVSFSDTRFVFTGWIGEGLGSYTGDDNPATVVVETEPIVETAHWQRQYLLTVLSDYGTTDGSGWYDEGVDVIFYLYPEVVELVPGEMRAVFSRWDGEGLGSYTGEDNPASCCMLSPITEAANWDIRYYLAVSSDYGTTAGSGWYDEGTVARFSVSPDSINFDDTTVVLFSSWTGAGDISYSGSDNPAYATMNSYITEDADWLNIYRVELSYSGCGSAEPYQSGEGWYTAGDTADIFSQLVVYDGSVRYHFDHWVGLHLVDPDSNATRLEILSYSPVEAVYDPFEVSPQDTISGVAGGSVDIPVILYNDEPVLVGSFGLELRFSSSHLIYNHLVNNLGWETLDGTEIGSGVVSISGGSSTPISVSGGDTLFYVNMDIHSTATGCCAVYCSNLTGDIEGAWSRQGIFFVTEGVSVTVTTSLGRGVVYIDGAPEDAPYTANWASGSTHIIGTDSIFNASAGERYLFSCWSDGGTRQRPVSVFSDTTFTADFAHQLQFTVYNPDGCGSPTPPVGSYWYDDGTEVSAFVESPDTARRMFCTGYSGTGNLTGGGESDSVLFVIDTPTSIWWEWQNMLYLDVESDYDTPDPSAGRHWYTPGVEVTASSDTADVLIPDSKRMHLVGWTGTGSVPADGDSEIVVFNLLENSSISWQWIDEFYLDFYATGCPGATPSLTDDGWFPTGALIPIEADSTTSDSEGNVFFFSHWASVPEGAIFVDTTSHITTVVADTSYHINAVYSPGVRVRLLASPVAAAFSVDGEEFTSAESLDVWFAYGTEHTIGVADTTFLGDSAGVFDHWSDGGEIFHTVGPLYEDTSFVAYLDKHYKVMVEKEPEEDTYGSITIDDRTYSSVSSVCEWWQDGTAHHLSVSSPDMVESDVRYLFASWSDGGARTHTTSPVSEPDTFVANYTLQNKCSIEKQPNEPYGTITVNSTVYEDAYFVEFWVDSGSTATIGVSSPDANIDTVWTFDSWSDGGDIVHTTGEIELPTGFVAYYVESVVPIDISFNTTSWSAGSGEPGATITMNSRDVIVLTNNGGTAIDLGLYVDTTGAIWLPGFVNGEDTYILRAIFNESTTPPVHFEPVTDCVRASLAWATADIFGPEGFGIAPDGSNNLWLQFVMPTYSSTTEEQTIIVKLKAKVHLP